MASAQIVLIPKKTNPDSFADFRPICLCTFISKVLTRVLATRLGVILPKLISNEQAGFVKGRSIHDNVLLAFELLQYIDKKCRGGNVVVKLDMMKAFDRVSWPFLKAVLCRFGFPTAFVNIVLGNLEATRLSVLVNGVSCGFFQPTRGVKQGDPLSPLLFILVSEALSRSLVQNMGVGLLSPYATRRGCPLVTHLAFADDIVIFVNGASGSLKVLSAVLKQYQEGSGQKVNFDKSFFVTSKLCSAQRIATMSSLLGMQSSRLPFRYLGVNLFKGRNRPIYHQHLLEKVDSKLLGWSRKLLSPGGRLTLIKHVLSTIPLYTAGSILLPRQTSKALEVKFANFLWGVAEGKSKRHWASWDKVCFPTSEGGLGVRSLNTVQQAYSAKLCFNFSHGASFWGRFMQASYPESRAGSAQSATWRRIQQQRSFVLENSQSVSGELIWKPSPFGNFTVSSAYNELRLKKGTCLSSSLIWGDGMSSKISVFMWKVFRQFLSFPDVIQRFGICLPSICPFCRHASAEMSHCLYYCRSAQQVWCHFGGIFGLPSTPASSLKSGCHLWWLSASTNTAGGFLARILPCLILWFLWCAYNQCIFEGVSFSVESIINRVMREALLSSISRPRRKGLRDDFLLDAGLVARFAAPPRRNSLWVKWMVPPRGRLKLNTDAIYGDRGAAGGACLRDSRGLLRAGLCFRVEASSALEAEALSLQFALQWCSSFAICPSDIEVDSLALVTLTMSGVEWIPWKLRLSVSFVRSCLVAWGSTIRHVYREANRVADALAEVGLCYNTAKLFGTFDSLPDKVKLAFVYDFRGFASLRTIPH